MTSPAPPAPPAPLPVKELIVLRSPPVPPRTVMRAKLVGITAAVALSFAMLVLPLTLPAAIMGHSELFGIPALLLALALTAACFGLAITLVLIAAGGWEWGRLNKLGQGTNIVLGLVTLA